MTLASETIGWIQDYLVYPRGPKAGEKFRLLPWEKKGLRGLFKKSVEQAAVSLARGNGKSTLASALGAACVEPTSPLTSTRFEALVVASSFSQSKEAIFRDVLFHLESLGHDIENRDIWRKADSAQHSRIECRATRASLRCLGSDPKRALGYQPNLVICDEGSAWPGQHSERMYNALSTSLGKQEGGKLLAIGTMPSDQEGHWFARLIGGQADFSMLFQSTEDSDPFDPQTWKAANPSLPHMPVLRRTIAKEAEKAKRDAGLLASFLHYRCNRGGSDIERSLLIGSEEWQRVEQLPPADRIGQMTLGIDTGENQSFTAASAFWGSTGRLETFAAVPSIPDLETREREGGEVGKLTSMAGRGELVLLGQRTVPLDQFMRLVVGRFGEPNVLVCDAWKIDKLRDACEEIGLRCPIVKRRQGPFDGDADVDEFRRGCLDDKVRPEQSLLMRSALSEAVVEHSASGSVRLTKRTQAGKRSKARTDAAVAAVLAVSQGLRMDKQGGGPRYEFDRVGGRR